MARNIDAEVLLKKLFPLGMVEGGNYPINAKAVKCAIEQSPTADVIPRSKVEELARENESLAKTVNEASELIHKLRNQVEKAKAEVAREIFEEIQKTFHNLRVLSVAPDGAVRSHVIKKSPCIDIGKFIEIKKKYTEEEEK